MERKWARMQSTIGYIRDPCTLSACGSVYLFLFPATCRAHEGTRRGMQRALRGRVSVDKFWEGRGEEGVALRGHLWICGAHLSQSVILQRLMFTCAKGMQLCNVYQLCGITLLNGHLLGLNKNICIATQGAVVIFPSLWLRTFMRISHLRALRVMQGAVVGFPWTNSYTQDAVQNCVCSVVVKWPGPEEFLCPTQIPSIVLTSAELYSDVIYRPWRYVVNHIPYRDHSSLFF